MDNQDRIRKEGAIKYLVTLLNSSNDEIKAVSALTGCALVFQNERNQNEFRKYNVIPILLNLLNSKNDLLLQCISHFLLDLSRANDKNQVIVVFF